MTVFAEALHARAPQGETALYGWLAGSWALDVTETAADGSTRRRPGEWHFGWVLEGRALQDTWIVPPRGQRGTGTNGPEYYGTTLRIPVPDGKTWRIFYADPVAQVQLLMTGQAEGRDIVQLGTDGNGTLRRWCFRDITPDSFRWTGEVATGPDSWFMRTEFLARRL